MRFSKTHRNTRHYLFCNIHLPLKKKKFWRHFSYYFLSTSATVLLPPVYTPEVLSSQILTSIPHASFNNITHNPTTARLTTLPFMQLFKLSLHEKLLATKTSYATSSATFSSLDSLRHSRKIYSPFCFVMKSKNYIKHFNVLLKILLLNYYGTYRYSTTKTLCLWAMN